MGGMGANVAIFEGIKLQEICIKHLPWIEPLKNETLPNYARRMMTLISDETPILLGVSFGAVLVQEMAKIRSFEKIIIVSGVVSPNEFPWFLKWIRFFSLQKWVPLACFFKWIVLGFSISEKNKKRYEKYFSATSKNYLNWAIKSLISWEGIGKISTKIYRIHGENDEVFPIRKLKSIDYIIPNSGHFVILQNYSKINKILKELI